MLGLICLLPIVGFIVLALFGSRIPRALAGTIGCGTVAGAGIIAALQLPQLSHGAINQSYGPWIEGIGAFTPTFSLQMDTLSATMVSIVCFIGFLIHVYSTEYMREDPGHNRFFAYLNLFVGAMLILLLADDMLLLFLGWEGVGLCSYLLIGFWYEDDANVRCAQKAFYVTRIGDVAFMIALFIIFQQVHDWSLPYVLKMLPVMTSESPAALTTVTLLLLIAAVAKSAQFPLQVWLPDAMAGPTPVSALLHSSTMVTAGVYLIARMQPVFSATPEVLYLVAVVGAVTAFYAGITAIGQNDIKRVLAYSTISQIGYMFLALGVGAFDAAIFHFFTHAFFKALLFLGAGAVIHAAHGEQDMRKLGGLRRKLPLTFWTFIAGSAALAALPLVTSGFYSKDAILWDAFAGHHYILWMLGVTTALLTGWYSARMVLMTFFGKAYEGKLHAPGSAIRIPLIILAVLALIAGFVETPPTLGGLHWWADWINQSFVIAAPAAHGTLAEELMTQGLAAAAGIGGILIAYTVFKKRAAGVALIQKLSSNGFYIDAIYQRIFVRGVERLSDMLHREWFDVGINFGLSLVHGLNQAVRLSQNGRVRWYAAALVVGCIIFAAGVLAR